MINTQVKIDKGIIEGVKENNSIVFKGIPFAKPPVGELRWKAPEEVDPWKGIYKADHFAAMCPQRLAAEPNPYYKEFYADPEYIREMSEDCLYLNVWVPQETEKADGLLPVAFYIHGGGFCGGYSSEMEFDGQALNRKGVIFVSIAYRLGVFGFLAHPWLSAENEQHLSGNYGILDQLMALRWVQNNIAAFGGAPDNITVYGQSAGCMSAQVLISSHLAEGAVAKAIFQSGVSCASTMLATPTLQEEEGFGTELVSLTGAKDLRDLREMDPETLMKAKDAFDQKAMRSRGQMLLVPNVDGYVLDKSVRDIWSKGLMMKIPYMAGVVTDDLGTSEENRSNRVPGILLNECEKWALKQEEVGGCPSYVYWFDHTLPGDGKPAWHSLELWYTMGTLGRSWRPMGAKDYALSEETVSAWANFMKTGNPEGEGGAHWPAYTKENPFVKHFE